MVDTTLQFRVVPASDIPLAYAIEIAVYPEGEPATQETISMRQKAAPELMFGCYDTDLTIENNPTGKLIAYIISTKAKGNRLTHASMYAHDPTGNAVCIHSVCTAASHQRRGIASKTLRAYLTHIRQLGREEEKHTGRKATVDRVLLIAHKELMGLYAGVGFREVGLSDVVHGPDPWYEMEYLLD